MHVLQSSFEERRPDFVSEKSKINLRVPNILEGKVSFLNIQFLSSFYFYQILNHFDQKTNNFFFQISFLASKMSSNQKTLLNYVK